MEDALNYILIMVGLILGIFIGMIVKQCPSCNYNCPYCNCPSCEPDTRQITKFEYPNNIRLYNEYGMVTTEEIIDDYNVNIFVVRIYNKNYGNKTDINGSLCIEHKFKEADIESLPKMNQPEDYVIQGMGYRLDCFELPTIKVYDLVEYELYIEQGTNQNQSVRISIQQG